MTRGESAGERQGLEFLDVQNYSYLRLRLETARRGRRRLALVMGAPTCASPIHDQTNFESKALGKSSTGSCSGRSPGRGCASQAGGMTSPMRASRGPRQVSNVKWRMLRDAGGTSQRSSPAGPISRTGHRRPRVGREITAMCSAGTGASARRSGSAAARPMTSSSRPGTPPPWAMSWWQRAACAPTATSAQAILQGAVGGTRGLQEIDVARRRN